MERIRCAWWSVFFCRCWRENLLKQQAADKRNLKVSSISVSLKNFITSNTYTGIELNAHNILNILVKCRDTTGIPELFLPGLMSSQTCEDYFRRTRSMTSTFSTVINFTVYDLLHRAKRSQAITEIMNELGEQYLFPRKEIKSQHLIPNNLPDNNCVSTVIFVAMQEAFGDLETLGNFLK